MKPGSWREILQYRGPDRLATYLRKSSGLRFFVIMAARGTVWQAKTRMIAVSSFNLLKFVRGSAHIHTWFYNKKRGGVTGTT